MKTELFSLVLITQLLALHIKEERTTRLLFPRGQTLKAGWGGRRGTGRHPAQPRVPQTPAAGSAASCRGTGPHPGPPRSAAAYGIPRPAEPMGSSSPPPPPSPRGLAVGSRASLRCPAVCKHPLTRGAGCLWDCPCSRCATGMLFF